MEAPAARWTSPERTDLLGSRQQILTDLVETTPGEAGKWFAAAKEAGLYDEALALGRRSPA